MSQAQLLASFENVLGVQHNPQSVQHELTQLRREVVCALHAGGGGHFGGCLSVLDLLLILYRQQLRVCPSQPRHPDRDRLVLSKGHASMALYAVLRRLGYFQTPLHRYARCNAGLEGHPDMLATPGIDFSTGSLGQGLSVGAGMALRLRSTSVRGLGLGASRPNVWVVLGDGECQEGQVWEAALLAAELRLSNLHAVVDNNGYQEWGWNAPTGDASPPVPRMAAKWRAFGWQVFECDGHAPEALRGCYTQMVGEEHGPSVLIAHTRKGHGVPLIEDEPGRFHCESLTNEEFNRIEEAFRGAG